MANSFTNPYPQFFNSTPTVYSGGKLYFYAAGTDTLQDTYSDSTLDTENTNPVVLNSAGRPNVAIFLSNLAYKVVLKDSSDNTIWTRDNYWTSDYSTEARFRSGSGSPNGSVAGTAGSASVDADAYWDFTNSILYICTTTGTTTTAVWTAINASTAASVVPEPQGRLTLTTATPVTASDVTAATAVYYTPDGGNICPVYNGSSFVPLTFTELTLTLVASHASGNNYDVFFFNDAGTVTIGTGPAWSSATSRGTGAGTTELSILKGFRVNTVAITLRNGSTTYSVDAQEATYLGTFRTTTTNGQTEDSISKRFLWNMYRRAARLIKFVPGTDSWNYSTASFQQAAGSTSFQVDVVEALQIDLTHVSIQASFINSTSTRRSGSIGVGIDSTTAASGLIARISCTDTDQGMGVATYHGFLGGGHRKIVWLEAGAGTDTQTWHGDNGQPALQQNGISGTFWA